MNYWLVTLRVCDLQSEGGFEVHGTSNAIIFDGRQPSVQQCNVCNILFKSNYKCLWLWWWSWNSWVDQKVWLLVWGRITKSINGISPEHTKRICNIVFVKLPWVKTYHCRAVVRLLLHVSVQCILYFFREAGFWSGRCEVWRCHRVWQTTRGLEVQPPGTTWLPAVSSRWPATWTQLHWGKWH